MRVIERLVVGVVLVLALLAAAGVAASVRLAGRHGTPAGIALAGLAAFAVTIAPLMGRESGPRIVGVEIRPSSGILDFFATLEAQGNRGAILELPYEAEVFSALWAPPRILAGAWHRRRTSACFGSYFLPEREKVAALAAALPETDAARELAVLGFTTIVVHDPKGAFGASTALRLARGTGRRRVHLRPLLATDLAAAWEIEVRPPRGAGGARAREGGAG